MTSRFTCVAINYRLPADITSNLPCWYAQVVAGYEKVEAKGKASMPKVKQDMTFRIGSSSDMVRIEALRGVSNSKRSQKSLVIGGTAS